MKSWSAVFLIVAILGVAAFTLPLFPIEQTHKEPVNYEVINQQTGLTSGLNQLTGLGTTSVTFTIRNRGNVNGDFSIRVQCQTQSGNQVTLTDSKFIQAGETGDLTVSTSEQISKGSCTSEINPAKKTVRTQEKVSLVKYLTSN